MVRVDRPIIELIKYGDHVDEQLNKAIRGDERKQQLLLDYPTVYLIYSKDKHDQYQVYVGETNNISRRTKQHLDDDIKVRDDWDELKRAKNPKMLVIGHQHFNKSLTLDIENTLMLYMLGVPNVKQLDNRRQNEQADYYTSDERQAIFAKIWRKLRQFDETLFPLEREIQDSAIFKASPFHKLTSQQEQIKDDIIDATINALMNDKTGQLILVEGEAGTGKTVLLSTIFYLLSFLDLSDYNPDLKHLSNYLLVNQEEQVKVYQEIVTKLELNHGIKDMVSRPTHFINQHKDQLKPAAIVLVDEAHLLLTRGKMSYQGDNQLTDILRSARVVVAVFDQHQMLKTESYVESEQIKELEDQARKQRGLFTLTNQLRLNANLQTVQWIHDITQHGLLSNIPRDNRYDLKIFSDVEAMYDQIKIRSKNQRSGLSRLVATFDWDYKGTKRKDGKLWMVKIGNFELPWNLQLPKPKGYRKSVKKIPWAEQPQTIDEIGSTFTIQGFDLNYSGVIIGPSVKYRNGHIVFDPSKSKNRQATNMRTLSDGKKKALADELLPNELNVLLTRGVNGMYIYAVDDQLREALLKAQNGTLK